MVHEAIPNKSKLAWATQYCQDRGLRKTQARDALLAFLVDSAVPVTWRTLSEDSHLGELCNRSTIYRLLVKLEQIGLVRRITVREKSPFFTIGTQ
jgi:Fe2+ or Zn2+ uptake regulation protein